MQKLRFVNADGTVIDLTDGHYGVVDWSGLSDSEIDIQSQQVPFHDGSVFLDALIKERTISVTVAVNDFGSLEERYRLRRELIKALNPKNGEGYLYYKNDFIEKRIGAIAELPSFSNKNQNDSGTLKASLTFNCLSPLWEDVEETVVDLNIGENVIIENEGDVDTNVKIEFLTNQVENPRIENLTTGQKISVEGSFSEEIRVDTSFGKKTIEQVEEEIKIKNVIGTVDFFTGNSNLFLMGYVIDGARQMTVMGRSESDIEKFTTLTTAYYSKYYDTFFLVGPLPVPFNPGFNWSEVDYFISMTECENILFKTSNNEISISTDGINFTTYDVENLSNPHGIAVDKRNKIFYTVSRKNIYRISSDGSYTSHEQSENLYDILFDDSSREMIIGSESGKILKGTIDNFQSIQLDTTEDITSVFYNDKLGIYFASGANNVLFKSYDGINWNKIETGLINNSNLKILGSSDILGSVIVSSDTGDILYSWDGDEFYLNTDNFPLSVDEIKFIPEKNIYVAICKIYLCVSDDGKFWRIVHNIQSFSKLPSICYFPEEDIIAVSTYMNQKYNVIYSHDGINWTEGTQDLGSAKSLRYIPNLSKIHAYDINGIKTSSDGVSWTDLSLGVQTYSSVWSNKFNKILYGGAGTIYLSENESSYEDSIAIGNSQDSIINFFEIDNFVFAIVIDSLLHRERVYMNPDYDNSGKVWIKLSFGSYVTISNSSLYILSNVALVKYIISKNMKNSISKNLGSYLGMNFIDENLNLYGNAISQIVDGEKTNIIDKVTSDSDMNLKLAPGKNVLRIDYDSGDMSARVVYRQKYVGV